MRNRKPTKLQKSTEIVKNSKTTQWCYVDINNEFKFMNTVFKIDDSVIEYKVNNKVAIDENGNLNNYTNEALMEEILVALGNDGKIKYYNQDYNEISEDKVYAVE